MVVVVFNCAAKAERHAYVNGDDEKAHESLYRQMDLNFLMSKEIIVVNK